MYFQLLQLEREGLIQLEWEPHSTGAGRELLRLRQIALTTNGHRLLQELQAKSRLGQVKKKVGDLLWVVITSIITTLVVLKIRGV
jgi:DNA-binding PadR family transcriptional regulator